MRVFRSLPQLTLVFELKDVQVMVSPLRKPHGGAPHLLVVQTWKEWAPSALILPDDIRWLEFWSSSLCGVIYKNEVAGQP
jgi:hypothetical protein